jgi:YihY family inner membrane protein
MSAANPVPETWELSGDDAWETLKRTGRLRLAKDAFTRFRASDGTSHARSLAFLLALLLVQGIIALVAIASVMRQGQLSGLVAETLRALAPGAAGMVLTDAVEQAHRAGTSPSYTGLLVTLVISSLVTACSLMGQMERGMNRLYGVEQDRPTPRKYGRALVLSLTAGTLTVGAFAAIALGHVATSSFASEQAVEIWEALRWPVGLILAIAGTALVFRWSPRRKQPAWSWLTFGASVSIGLGMLTTLGLNVFFQNSGSFGRTYGSLAGLVALLLWAFAVSAAVLYGAAIAAQLEAVRADDPSPRDETRSIDEADEDRRLVHAGLPSRSVDGPPS